MYNYWKYNMLGIDRVYRSRKINNLRVPLRGEADVFGSPSMCDSEMNVSLREAIRPIIPHHDGHSSRAELLHRVHTFS